MAIAVVESFEPVDIYEQHRQRPTGLLGRLELPLQTFIKRPAIGQSGQCIRFSQAFHPLSKALE